MNFAFLRSSKDPKEISRTVKGAAVTFLGAAVSVAVAFGVDPAVLPGDSEVADIAQTVGNIAAAGSIVIGGVMHLYGVIAKFVNTFSSARI